MLLKLMPSEFGFNFCWNDPVFKVCERVWERARAYATEPKGRIMGYAAFT